VEADPDSLANAPRVHLTGKRYLPVVEMLRNYWLPGESLPPCTIACAATHKPELISLSLRRPEARPASMM
jgi:hypothetical protein